MGDLLRPIHVDLLHCEHAIDFQSTCVRFRRSYIDFAALNVLLLFFLRFELILFLLDLFFELAIDVDVLPDVLVPL